MFNQRYFWKVETMILMVMVIVMRNLMMKMLKVFLERGGETAERLADEAAGLQVGVLNFQELEYLGV